MNNEEKIIIVRNALQSVVNTAINIQNSNCSINNKYVLKAINIWNVYIQEHGYKINEKINPDIKYIIYNRNNVDCNLLKNIAHSYIENMNDVDFDELSDSDIRIYNINLCMSCSMLYKSLI